MSYRFSSPIKLNGRFGTERTIGDVWQASEFLLEWTSRLQGLEYYTALDTCSAALKGRGSTEVAREAFRNFAVHVDILAVGAERSTAVRGTDAGYDRRPERDGATARHVPA